MGIVYFTIAIATTLGIYLVWNRYLAWKEYVVRTVGEIEGKRPSPSPTPPPKKTEVDMLREYIKSPEFEERVDEIVRITRGYKPRGTKPKKTSKV